MCVRPIPIIIYKTFKKQVVKLHLLGSLYPPPELGAVSLTLLVRLDLSHLQVMGQFWGRENRVVWVCTSRRVCQEITTQLEEGEVHRHRLHHPLQLLYIPARARVIHAEGIAWAWGFQAQSAFEQKLCT